MRSVLALGLLTLCVSANAATAHHSRPPVRHLRPSARVAVRKKGYAVPGWTEDETRAWMHNGDGKY